MHWIPLDGVWNIICWKVSAFLLKVYLRQAGLTSYLRLMNHCLCFSFQLLIFFLNFKNFTYAACKLQWNFNQVALSYCPLWSWVNHHPHVRLQKNEGLLGKTKAFSMCIYDITFPMPTSKLHPEVVVTLTSNEKVVIWIEYKLLHKVSQIQSLFQLSRIAVI